MLPGQRAIASGTSEICQFAVVMGDLARPSAAANLELAVDVDSLLPLFLALVDVNEPLERRFGERRAVGELQKKLLCAVEQAGAHVVFCEREHRLMPLRII